MKAKGSLHTTSRHWFIEGNQVDDYRVLSVLDVEIIIDEIKNGVDIPRA